LVEGAGKGDCDEIQLGVSSGVMSGTCISSNFCGKASLLKGFKRFLDSGRIVVFKG
jgi:hypothetical protein